MNQDSTTKALREYRAALKQHRAGESTENLQERARRPLRPQPSKLVSSQSYDVQLREPLIEQGPLSAKLKEVLAAMNENDRLPSPWEARQLEHWRSQVAEEQALIESQRRSGTRQQEEPPVDVAEAKRRYDTAAAKLFGTSSSDTQGDTNVEEAKQRYDAAAARVFKRTPTNEEI